MRLLSFTFGGQSSFGIGVEDGVIDLGSRTDRQDLGSCLGALDQLRAFEDAPADHAWEAISFDIPIPNQRRMLCAGLNYHKKYPLGGEVKLPKQPVYFNKPPGSLVAHNEALVRPIASVQLDYEVELAVVIGRSGRHISESDALAHVAGYTILNDGSVRDWQRHGVAAGKNFYRSGSCGPWIVTSDLLPDPSALSVTTRVNGEQRQHSSVNEMIFSVEELVAYMSQIMPLEPGDIIATGSPEGTGGSMEPQVWLSAGDQIEFEVPGIGLLKNSVVDEGI
ncbi:MAG: fumarylacetoacetate hydrolase family protein [Actinomycetota bacterium]|jgi:2-keto-4-pentenoate hydratase/2-oxohepta-3-ene-1,7-dioic acid hydratase in catechol pathway|nr:5-carboxymethyl-2-hydroxymuconate isomerase [Actinomycetota bacterium]MEC9113469.1 fumarylacetoacetate hydrolase family protein [Actinomycetota bacterium]